MIRYIRAFFIALKMTLRGEKPEPLPNAGLRSWVEDTSQAVRQTFKDAELKGFNSEKRKKVVVRVDGRQMTMETILSAIRYHTTQEYPHLLQQGDQHSVTAIYASNMNDQYSLSRLIEHEEVAPLAQSLNELKTQIELIPSSNGE